MARNPVMDAAVRQVIGGYRQGDLLEYRGFDIVATAQAARGGGPPDTQYWVVLNNNSTHYLVCHGEDRVGGVFLHSFPYETEEEAIEAYTFALILMMKRALSH